MIKPLVLLALAGSAALLLLAASRPGAGSSPAPRTQEESAAGFQLADLAWLAGHWKAEGAGKLTEELWTPARGQMMLGLNRTSRAEGKGQFEFLRIEQAGDEVVYLASPGGKAPTAFRLVHLDAGYAVFENPEHDFPKLIEYRLEQGRLTASTAGDEPGPSWTYTRAGSID